MTIAVTYWRSGTIERGQSPSCVSVWLAIISGEVDNVGEEDALDKRGRLIVSHASGCAACEFLASGRQHLVLRLRVLVRRSPRPAF